MRLLLPLLHPVGMPSVHVISIAMYLNSRQYLRREEDTVLVRSILTFDGSPA